MSRKLSDHFDVVVMLTWSNWKTEPRSNRYHYATRFAKQLPVLFVQPEFMDPMASAGLDADLAIEASGVPGIDLLHFNTNRGEAANQQLLQLLWDRGFKRPLVWIYNARDFPSLIQTFRDSQRALLVYHATENYFTHTETAPGMVEVADMVRGVCANVDLIIGVTEAVTTTYQEHIETDALFATVENGCDAALAAEYVASHTYTKPERPIAVFQGGINQRLDFSLLHRLLHLLPDWDFWFCGNESSIAEWEILKSHPNVTYWGSMAVEQLAAKMHAATVGLVPFVQDDWIFTSLPLKAFEYVSFGLPVVTVPIAALQDQPTLFSEATTAEEFAFAMQDLAEGRTDEQLLAFRYQTAQENSYDQRFASAEALIHQVFDARTEQRQPLNMAVLYDDRSTNVGTIHEHLDAFRKYSANRCFFVPVTGYWGTDDPTMRHSIDLSVADVLIMHYSVRLSLEDHLSEGVAQQIERHTGLKILFIQDEYDFVETARQWMERLRFDLIYTCVPEKGREIIYPPHRFPGTTFLQTITGFVPESDGLDEFATPLEERELHIAYRGRMLPFVYGRLGYEKYRIGVDVKRLAEERSVPVDIEVDDTKRIYGDDWYRFLGSARATLGTESGASIFDITGEVSKAVTAAQERNPNVSFDKVQRKILSRYELPVEMNQVSPKIFEAIRLRTALVLFEGTYSGVVEAHKHYIPLNKDCSNIDEVFEKLNDLDYLRELTERAYEHVIASGKYSYQQFVESVDKDIAARCFGSPRFEIVSVPAFAIARNGNAQSIIPPNNVGHVLNDTILRGSFVREQVIELADSSARASVLEEPPTSSAVERANGQTVVIEHTPARPPASVRLARSIWHLIPKGIRHGVVRRGRQYLSRHNKGEDTERFDYRMARRAFMLLPGRVRDRLVTQLNQ